MFTIKLFLSPDFNNAGTSSVKPKSAAATALITKLMTWQSQKKPRFGHQDSLAYGKKWYFEKGKIFDTSSGTAKTDGKIYLSGKSDIVDVTFNAADNTFKYPTVFGWDIGNMYAGRDFLINGVIQSDLINHIKFVHSKGGVNTFSWHCPNPTKEEGFAEFFKENDVNYFGGDVLNKINNDSTTNTRFEKWLFNIIAFFKQIDDLGIPFIFRPLHEANLNNTFWWDKSQANRDMFKNLWRALHQIFCSRFSNILFCYSINDVWQGGALPSNFKDMVKSDFFASYPGDNVVDIYGLDIYQKDGLMSGESNANFISRFKQSCQALNEIVPSKPVVVSETGTVKTTSTDWWTTSFQSALTDTKVAFAMIWRNPCKFKDANSTCFGPFVGSSGEANFKIFYKNNKHMFI